MRRTMDLRRLLDDRRAPGLEVSGIASDSRRVQRGDLYVARRGNAFDGHDFVGDAVDAGAVAVVSQRAVDAAVPNIVAEEVGWRGRIGAVSHGEDQGGTVVVGVTLLSG